MFLVSVKCEYENNIKHRIGMLCKRFVITEYNKDVIDYFKNKGKEIIIILDNNYNSSNLINDERIHYCNNNNYIETISKIGIKDNTICKKIIGVVAVILLIFISFFIINGTQNGKEKFKSKSKIEKNINVSIKGKNYLFLGDSITEYYNLEKYYSENIPVVNSGIGGNKTYDILNNMDERVYQYNPTTVFLLIGTNDLFHRTDLEIVNNIEDIVKKIHENRKNAKIYVESIYPVNNNTDNDVVVDWMVSTRDNDRIKKINKMLKENSKEYDYKYLDFYSLLKDENDDLKLEYTVDGLHISEKGYEKITKKIMEIIEGEENDKK